MQIDKLNNYRSRFDPQSPRAIRGLAFQKSVEAIITPWFQRTWNSREWLLLQDKCLTDYQLNMLEHTWGDIVIVDLNLPYKIFIECVSVGSEKSIFPEHKIKKFNGANKYYCFGWEDEKRFVHSNVWNSYARKLPIPMKNYRSFLRKNITGLRNQFKCVDSFCEAMFRIDKIKNV